MLSEKIYALRRKNGLSQEQLAERIGVSRQSVSKWEGGLSTPDLDKLKALSECFQVSIDELTGNQTSSGFSGAEQEEREPIPRKREESKTGIFLCAAGAACLILFGILTVIHPSAAEQINGSSMVTLNGTGILMIAFILLMAVGIIMIFKKK